MVVNDGKIEACHLKKEENDASDDNDLLLFSVRC